MISLLMGPRMCEESARNPKESITKSPDIYPFLPSKTNWSFLKGAAKCWQQILPTLNPSQAEAGIRKKWKRILQVNLSQGVGKRHAWNQFHPTEESRRILQSKSWIISQVLRSIFNQIDSGLTQGSAENPAESPENPEWLSLSLKSFKTSSIASTLTILSFSSGKCDGNMDDIQLTNNSVHQLILDARIEILSLFIWFDFLYFFLHV